MRRTRGFTLLELVIAIAITALVMAMVGGILVSTLEADENVNRALSSEKVGYGVVSLIRRDLEACYTYALGAPALKGERGSEGAVADRISFVTASEGDPDPQSGRRAKLQRVGYKLQREQAATNAPVLALYRYAEPYTSTKDDPLTAGTYGFIATGIKSLKLSYLDPKDKAWKDDEWKETDRIPLAVKISVELAPAENQQQPSGFGLNPAVTVESTVMIPTVSVPAPDPDPNTPPR